MKMTNYQMFQLQSMFPVFCPVQFTLPFDKPTMKYMREYPTKSTLPTHTITMFDLQSYLVGMFYRVIIKELDSRSIKYIKPKVIDMAINLSRKTLIDYKMPKHTFGEGVDYLRQRIKEIEQLPIPKFELYGIKFNL